MLIGWIFFMGDKLNDGYLLNGFWLGELNHPLIH